MARPKKQTVDYFPHSCNHGKTMFILEQKYGNDGYAFWFKLLEMLGGVEGHFLKFENGMDWEFLIAKTKLDKEKCIEILDLLSSLGAIDKELWKDKIVWSDNFIENIREVYRKRAVEIPLKPSFGRKKPTSNGINGGRNPQSKVEYSKVNEMKVNEMKLNENIKEIITYLNLKANKNFRPDSKIAVKNITARLKENYTLEDFKKVIDIKCSHWLEYKNEKITGVVITNKDTGEKQDMSIYLSPDTLFGNKFEKYLNQVAKKQAIKEAVEREKEWQKIKEEPENLTPEQKRNQRIIFLKTMIRAGDPKCGAYREELKNLEKELIKNEK